MKAVGIRELKGNLSRYLRKVQAGEGIVVTDRAKEIAVILPYKLEGEEEKVLGLIQQGAEVIAVLVLEPFDEFVRMLSRGLRVLIFGSHWLRFLWMMSSSCRCARNACSWVSR